MSLNIQAVVSLDTRMFTAGIRGIEAQINQFAGLAMMQFGGIAQQVSAMWGAFGPAGAAISALGSVVQAGASYEQQMMRVASYTQATGDTMERLSSEGAAMAAKFGFSLDQVGTSMASLALAGVEAADMGDVLRASLLLASATLGDANQSAELITSTLKIFQEDMAKAGQVADLFAGAIASSPLDLQRLSDSMKYAGATGAAFGMSMEQVVGEIAAFHQVGLRGQMAGTSFRGALLEMSAAASQAKGAVGAALQGWIPATEGLVGAVRRLNDAGVDASVVIQELGKRAGPGVAALMKLGADAMEDLSGKIRANSSVSSMHEKQMEALAGQYKLLQGEVSALAKKIFDALAPGFKAALDQIRASVQTFSDFAAKLGGISGVINAAIPGLVRLATTVIGINAAIKALNFAGINTGIQSIGGLFSKMAEARKAAAEVATLKTELSSLENALRQVKLAGAGGMVSATDTSALSDLTAKANSAKAAFSALQAQGAQPFIDQAAFAAAPRFDELNRKMADARNYAAALQDSMRRIQFSPDPGDQKRWNQLAEIYRRTGTELSSYHQEYAKLEAAVRQTGLKDYNAALAAGEKNMNAAAASAAKFQKSMDEKSLRLYNAALDENAKKTKVVEASMKKAQTAAGGWTMGLSKLQVGLSVAAAAMAGWQIGKFISQLRVWGTDHTVHEWLSLGIAKLIDFRTTMSDVTGELSPELTALQAKIKGLKEEGAALANTFIEKLPKSAFYLSNLNTAMRDVEERARAGAEAIRSWFDFDAGSSGGFSGILVQLREMGELADAFGKDLAGAFDPKDIRAFRQEITDLEGEANSLKTELQSKQESYNSSLAKAVQLDTQAREIEWEIDILKSQQKRSSEDERTIINQQCVVLREKLEAISNARDEAKISVVESQAALAKLSGQLGDLNERVQATRERFDEISGSIANARDLQNALNAAWEEWDVEDKAAQAATGLDDLAAAYRNTGLSLDAAKAGTEALGNGLEYFVGVAKDAGVSVETVGKNLQWMAKNQETARGVLERLGVKTEEVNRFMVTYGENAIEVARRMATLGESEEAAASSVGVFGQAAAEVTQTLASNTKAIAENRKELMFLASISGARLTRLTQNLSALRDALTPPAGAPAIDLAWLRDLGSFSRLPNLGNVKSWLEKFDSFATGVRDICQNVGPNIDFSWVAPIANFKLPDLSGASDWGKNLKSWAASIRAELPSLERFADVLTSLNGSLAALNDATLKIVFKDESLLSRIEGHLSTLASLKGVIWA